LAAKRKNDPAALFSIFWAAAYQRKMDECFHREKEQLWRRQKNFLITPEKKFDDKKCSEYVVYILFEKPFEQKVRMSGFS
jgi:hypothetical protein